MAGTIATRGPDLFSVVCAAGEDAVTYEPVPPAPLTVDRVETRPGPRRFSDGHPYADGGGSPEQT